jgi:peptidoglycan hydrolase-like amidase
MARAGASFEEILKHYYTGVRVTSLEPARTALAASTLAASRSSAEPVL